MNDEELSEVDELYVQIAELCGGKNIAGVVTCLSMLWVQSMHMMGLSKQHALNAASDFINEAYPEEGDNNGNRTIQ